MMDSIPAFLGAIRASGLEPPSVVEPGRLHRFPGIGKRSSNRAGWCLLFEDGRGGSFGDWSSGFSENWQAGRREQFSREERAAFRRKVAAVRFAAERERAEQQNRAASRASAIWHGAASAPANHPYLLRKQVGAHLARIYKGSLLLPVMKLDGSIRSLQFIAADGGKKLLSHGQKKGCAVPVNRMLSTDLVQPQQVVICEGWATGATLAADTPNALVLAAIDAGNLMAVALCVRSRWPDVVITIAGDDDRKTAGNPGRSKATVAAIEADALLALPQWPEDAPDALSDFNDLACWISRQGEEVRHG